MTDDKIALRVMAREFAQAAEDLEQATKDAEAYRTKYEIEASRYANLAMSYDEMTSRYEKAAEDGRAEIERLNREIALARQGPRCLRQLFTQGTRIRRPDDSRVLTVLRWQGDRIVADADGVNVALDGNTLVNCMLVEP